MPFTEASFTAEKQSSFRSAIAATAMVPTQNVVIVAMNEVSVRRAASLDITTQIRVADDAAASSLVSSWDTKTLNTNLKRQGIPEATSVSQPVKKSASVRQEENNSGVFPPNTVVIATVVVVVSVIMLMAICLFNCVTCKQSMLPRDRSTTSDQIREEQKERGIEETASNFTSDAIGADVSGGGQVLARGLTPMHQLAPHSVEIERKMEWPRTVEMVRGHKGMVGFDFFRNDGLTSGPCHIWHITPNSPADESGCFKVGDAIFEIDGESVLNLGMQEIRSLMSGLPNSRMTVLLQADSDMHIWVKELKQREERNLAISTHNGTAAASLAASLLPSPFEPDQQSPTVALEEVRTRVPRLQAALQSDSQKNIAHSSPSPLRYLEGRSELIANQDPVIVSLKAELGIKTQQQHPLPLPLSLLPPPPTNARRPYVTPDKAAAVPVPGSSAAVASAAAAAAKAAISIAAAKAAFEEASAASANAQAAVSSRRVLF